MIKTFKEFMSEAQITDSAERKTKVEDKKIQAFLKKHCSDAYDALIKNEVCIFRGFTSRNDNAFVLQPSAGERVSENTGNSYTILIDNSPKFKGWPKRSKSAIATTKFSKADSYANGRDYVYALFPFNGVKIASVEQDDIWDSKLMFSNSVTMQIEEFASMLSAFVVKNDFANHNDYSKFKSILGQAFKRDPEHRLYDKDWFLERFGKKGESLIEYFSEVHQKNGIDGLEKAIMLPFDPELLGYKLFESPATFLSTVKHGETREVWFDGKCLAVKYQTVEDLFGVEIGD